MDFSDCDSIEDIKLKQYLLQMNCIFPDEDLLYHYTSPQGLSGILTNDNIELRFSRIDSLNDITEGINIIDYYKDICIRLLNKKKIEKQFFDSIINIRPINKLLFTYARNPPGLINGSHIMDFCISEFITYVFCFSTLSDSLPLWNYYLKNGCYEGFNLGFSSLKLKESFHYHQKVVRNSKFIVVEYDDTEKDDILSDFIEALYRFRNTDDAKLSKTKEAISQELFKWRYSFKPECFSHEKEVRLIMHLPLNNDKSTLAPFIKTKVRFEDNKCIPKYVFAALTDKSALREITISPMFSEEGRKILSMELLKKGYDAKINHSKIPIRF